MGVFRQHVAVAAGQHHRQAGIALANDHREFDAVHAGHDDVGEDEIGGELVLGQNYERSIGVGSAANRVAEILQQFGGELPDIVIVFHHKHAIAAAPYRLAADSDGLDRVGGHCCLRQKDREGRAVAGAAGDLDVAAGLFGKTEGLAET